MNRAMAASWVSAATMMAWVPPVGADPVQKVRCRDTEPIAVRGGVLMAPLEAGRDGDGWPQTLELVPVGGDPIAAIVAWIHAATPTRDRQWAEDPRGLAVRAVQPADDSSVPGSGAPYLLARLPRDGGGPLRLGNQTLHPRWRNQAGPPPRRPGWTAQAALELAVAPDRPDPDSPFEYWRWVLLADRMALEPPSSHSYGAAGHLVAEHYAGIWRLGLAQLARIDPGVSARCRALLTEICRDGQKPFAAWVIDPATVGGLLAILLNFERRDWEIAEAAAEWADLQDVIVMREAPPGPGLAAMAVVNPLREPISVRFSWLGSRRIVAAATVEPGTLTRVVIEGPPVAQPGRADLSRPAADVHVLLMDAAGRQRRLTFRVGAVPALPPGFRFTALRPPMTLAEAQAGWQQALSPERSTTVELRKISRRWELFIDCRRPVQAQPSPDLMAATGVWDTRGIEAVTVFLGPAETGVTLTVPETGWHRIFRGDHDGTLEVHRRSYHDRWFCRIVIPERWHGEADDDPAMIGLVRTHGDGPALETSPFPTLPWRMDPGQATINLSSWDDLGQ
jgi:hypothetical protein